MNGLSVRLDQDEQMDDPGLDPEVYDQVLSDLSRLNRWTFAARPTIDFLDRAVGDTRHFRLLDVGFGHGDMLRAIARWARRRGISAELVGIDLNAKSQVSARSATPDDLCIDYRTGDYRDVLERFDVIVSSLVAHHISADELRDFMRYMEKSAGRGWFISDLHRHFLAHRLFPVLARLAGVHRIVLEDGLVSIARSFRAADWRAILEDAGIPDSTARIVRRFPFKLCVERLR
jgi:2-polyprenyl-3-methyl-5-hydroxy-6-metoxy-1,4-benzoquinol methylase